MAQRALQLGTAVTVVSLVALASLPALARTLSFDERVAAQKAIEQVYWSQRIWPKDNPGPKPPLATVLPDEAVRSKVDDYLRKSNALERWWQRPITGEQLQAELNRMATDTRDGETLQALYHALGDDAFVIAETLARQTLVDRLIRNWYSSDSRFHGALKRSAEAALASCSSLDCMRAMGGTYRETSWRLDTDGDAWTYTLDGLAKEFGTGRDSLPIGRLSGLREMADGFVVESVVKQNKGEIVTARVVWPKRSFDDWWGAERGNVGSSIEPVSLAFMTTTSPSTACTNDSWRPTLNEALDPRQLHTAVWTGTEMIVWGGYPQGLASTNTGARYNPATDSWTPTSSGSNVPVGRGNHTAVWTGTEMIVWGGDSGGLNHPLSTGGRYNPSTDAWTATSTGANDPAPRFQHAAVWTGAEMIVFGGYNGSSTLNTGGRYNPSTDSWVATSTAANVPTARRALTAVWTGSRMIVWGGYTGSVTPFNTGGLYDPASDQWTPTSTGTGVPPARFSHTAVWTGSEMIVWGGSGLNSGGRYNPSTDAWTATSTGANVPAARASHAAVWTGGVMIVWGGVDSSSNTLSSGGRYDPIPNTWSPTSTGPNLPQGRSRLTAVWTGTEMIVFGGTDGGPGGLNTGGRYNPSSDSWIATSTGLTTPAARDSHTAVWTGAEMIVWGGADNSILNSGGRYSPATDSWTPTSTGANVPAERILHSAVWTGTEMIVWGGQGASAMNTGARYNPLTDAWVATSTGANVPAARASHTAVWTGTQMIVWGGNSGSPSSPLNTGARYSPSSNTWSATSLGPSKRWGQTAVWTGTEMIVWGGNDNVSLLSTGGRYNPVSDAWSTTATGPPNPSGRYSHTAVWTGNEMIVWAGYGNPSVNTGGRYDPSANTWTATSTAAGVPTARSGHTAVWTGAEMIVWGGSGGGNTGGRYDPTLDSWIATSTGTDVPTGRSEHTAVWTGTEMIVWGGSPTTASGGRYCACPSGRIVYRDADGDGYGNFAISIPSCDGSIPAGYAADGTDCNDANPSIHPGASESCNGFDDDCDGVIDNGGGSLCNDSNVCTDDVCQGVSGCAHAFNASPCDDGDPCTSYDTCVAGTCSSGPSGPAAEIRGVALSGHGPTILSWSGVGGGASYDLATSTLNDLRANATTTATCLANDVSTVSYGDTQPDPATGSGYYYLVRGTNACGTGSYGFDSAGGERLPTAACP